MTDVPVVLAASEMVSNSHPGGSFETRWRFLVSFRRLSSKTASPTSDYFSQTLGMAAVESKSMTTLTACEGRDEFLQFDKPSEGCFKS